MQYIKTCCFFLFLSSLSFSAFTQSTYLAPGDKQAYILSRMEILMGKDSILNFSKNQPLNRQKYIVAALPSIEAFQENNDPSEADKYNLRSLYLNNQEFLSSEQREDFKSKKPFWKKLFTSPANLFETHSKDFDLVINPLLSFQLSKEKDNDANLFLNSRGISIRGKIANRIGFYTSLVENQERAAGYVQEWITEREAVPGVGNYKEYRDAGGTDYFDARGYITFTAAKYIDIAFGYDNQFIGNGYRSLFLNNTGSSNLFLKLNTRIWKFNYQNLFMELHNADRRTCDKLLGKKYAAMHHLDMAVAKWLNIGLFEGIVFNRPNRFDFSYLNPIIFYRSVEFQNGSPDNAIAGLDAKANLFGKVQLYGQLL